MKAKHIITISAFMLFTLASFIAKAGGDIIYIRTYLTHASSALERVYVWKNGTTEKVDFKTTIGAGKDEKDNVTEFANLLSSYLQQGYHIKSVTNLGGGVNSGMAGSSPYIIEYILEKE